MRCTPLRASFRRALIAFLAATGATTLALPASQAGASTRTPAAAAAARPVAAAPAQGEPGIMAPVDLSTLDPTPIPQWGVVGTGTSTSIAKPQVWDFAEIGNRIYVGGAFTGVQRDATSAPQSQSYLAAFDRDSGEWISTFRPTLNAAVLSLAVNPDGNLLVGGEFTSVNGASRTGLVLLDPATGATVSSFGASITAANNPSVRRIITAGSQIYVAGQISRVNAPNGAPWAWNAARLDARTGAVDTAWLPRFMGGVWDLAVDTGRGRVHGAGFFTSIDGQAGTALMGTVSMATGAPVAGLQRFVPNDSGQTTTTSISYADDRIYVGGAQHAVQVLDATTNARLGFSHTGIGCTDFDFRPAFNANRCPIFGGGDMQVMRVAAGGTVLVGCHCYQPYPGQETWSGRELWSSFTNTRHNQRYVLSFRTTDSRPASTFVPALREPQQWGTYGLFTDSKGCLYVGGDYSRTATGLWLGGFGRFCAPSAAPGALTATGVAPTATLSWQASTGPLATAYYKVYRDGTFLGDTTGTSFGVSGLVAGRTYRFTVRTRDVAGRLSAEAAVSVTMAASDTQAPTVPTTPAATVTERNVTLTWGASTDQPNPGGIGLSGYLVHRDWQYVAFVPAGTTTWTDTNVQAGNRRYELRAIDRSGNTSASAVVNATIADTLAPNVPGTPTATVAGRDITLTWAASTDLPDPGGIGLSGYLVHRDWQYVAFVPAGTTTWTDTNVQAGNRRYELRAIDRNSNVSAPVLVTATIADTQAPTVPTGVSGQVAGTSVTLNWAAATDLPDPGGIGLSGYLVHRDWEFVAFVPAGTTTWTDTNVAAGNRRYEVRAIDRNSNISAPAAPVNLTVG